VVELEKLLLVLARSLVEEPAPEDMGKIIGRQGRTIRAIRTVVKAASVKLGKRVSVEVPD
jgi:predicted RNA-binding protein Jag